MLNVLKLICTKTCPPAFYVICWKCLRNRATIKQYLEHFANGYYFLPLKEVTIFKIIWTYVQRSPLCVQVMKHMTARYVVSKTIRALHVPWLLVAEVRVRTVTTHIILRGKCSIISAESCRWIFQCTSKEFYEMLMLPVTCLKITGLSKAAILKKHRTESQTTKAGTMNGRTILLVLTNESHNVNIGGKGPTTYLIISNHSPCPPHRATGCHNLRSNKVCGLIRCH